MKSPPHGDLAITGICVSFGYVESATTEVVFLQWEGEPFKSIRECLNAFTEECKRHAQPQQQDPKWCCEATRTEVGFTASFCYRCGTCLGTLRYRNLNDYVRGLRTTCDGFGDSLYPFEPNNVPMEMVLGQWRLAMAPVFEGQILYIPGIDCVIEGGGWDDYELREVSSKVLAEGSCRELVETTTLP